MLAILVQIFFGCASNAGNISGTGSTGAGSAGGKQKAPSLIALSPQEAVYNGKGQPISFSYTGKEALEIVYYPSLKAREEDRGGSHDAPSQAGTYYVLVRGPYEEVFVEYRILRHPVKIEAAAVQEAIFNGNPKRVTAEADPPIPLFYSYYPNWELRDTAIKAEEEAILNGDTEQALTINFKGYKRIDSAPTEQGTYYVWIYFPGDENYMTAQAVVEFTILPAPAASSGREKP